MTKWEIAKISVAARCIPFNTYKYDIPVFVDHDGQRPLGHLTITRDPSGWEGKVYVRPDLYMNMSQVSSETNGGFWHLSHEDFLGRVRVVFGFSGGVDFDFAHHDFRPFFKDEPAEEEAFTVNMDAIRERFT